MSVVATGQDTCVGSVSAIQCPGTAGTTDCSTISYCGQDAQYQTWDRKWDIRGTDREKVVVDTQTGIAYQYDYVENKDYQHAVAYCNSLDYGGFNDWMLPDMHALLNIVDYGDPSGTQVFDMPVSGTFWTSTVLYNNVDRHWTVSFADGSNRPTDNPEKLYVRCIRITSPSIPNPRFKTETVGDKTRVMDMATGMMWNMNTGPAMEWRQALAYCELQDCCGYSDWRLPNVNELRSLLNMAKGNPATDLPGFDVDIYWTSTHAGRGVTIFKIDFSIGMLSQGLQSEKHPVICVRDGAIIYE